jgi:hypothetical protein
MKSFAQYITEKRTTLIALRHSKFTDVPVDIPGIENPSNSNELMSFVLRKTSYEEARFLIHGKKKKFVLWDAALATHWEVMNGEEGSKTAYLDNEKDYFQGTVQSWKVAGKESEARARFRSRRGKTDKKDGGIRYWTIDFTDGHGMPPSSSIINTAIKSNRVLSQMKKDADSGKIQNMEFKGATK